MRIAVCDGNPADQKTITDFCLEWSAECKIPADIFLYPSAEAFIFAWPDLAFDLVFTEVKLQNMSGIELAEYIRKTDPHIMLAFVTGFAEYALSGYDVNALHYIVKPVSKARFFSVLEKAYAVYQGAQNAALTVSDAAGQLRLPFGDIYYIEMFSHTAAIRTSARAYEQRATAEGLLGMLPENFIRCHRSYIVNLLKIERVCKDTAVLSNGEHIPVSRNRHKAVYDAFMDLYGQGRAR